MKLGRDLAVQPWTVKLKISLLQEMKLFISVELTEGGLAMRMKVPFLLYPIMFPYLSKIHFTGHKSFVHAHLNYLVIVSPPFFPTASSTSVTVRNLALSANATESDVTKVTVFDPENRLVAFSGTFKQGVREIISQWGHIFVLTTDGKV
jgi:hypothetical protein